MTFDLPGIGVLEFEVLLLFVLLKIKDKDSREMRFSSHSFIIASSLTLERIEVI